MSIALPGCAGLFSVLQEAFHHEEKDRPRRRLSKTLHGFLDNFQWLAKDLTSRPTRIAELIPDQSPHTEGGCDAAGAGMGGLHFVPTTPEAPEQRLIQNWECSDRLLLRTTKRFKKL